MVRLTTCLFAAAFVFAGSVQATDLKIGDAAPDFTVKGVDGEEYSLKSLTEDGGVVVVAFTCNQCPVAVAYEDRFIEFNKQFADKDVKFIAINSNNQTEDLEAMKTRAEEKEFNFIYAFDESGKAGTSYGAKVTPELFVIKDGKVAYHGAFDDNQREPTKHYLADAVNALLEGEQPVTAETKAFGCGIKIKK
jgi:peroxiredoxin